jgi:hypothetical protein
MRETTIYLHNKLGKQKQIFSWSAVVSFRTYFVRWNFFRRAEDIDGYCDFGNTDTKQVMSPRIDILL